MLISMSMLQGDLKAAASHVHGLKQLVMIRGGEQSLCSFGGYLRERVFGHFIMWELTQSALRADPGPIEYPKHPFSPGLCRCISNLPPGLKELALSGSINSAVIQLIAGIVLHTSRILNSKERRKAEVRRMLVCVYALSRQSRLAKLNTVEQVLIVALVEVCISLGSTRNLHWVLISYQQSRISSLLAIGNDWEMLKQTYRHAFIWMGAVLLATGNMDSDSWRLGKQLVAMQPEDLDWSERIELYERYIWTDELSIGLAQNLK